MNFYNREETQHHLMVCMAVERHLFRVHNVIPRREWYLILDHEDKIVGIPRFEITHAQKERRDKYRCPDFIWMDKNMLWVLEIDGYVHYIKSAKTNDRNEIYRNNNCKFIVIDTFELKEGKTKVTNRSIEKIINELDLKIEELKK